MYQRHILEGVAIKVTAVYIDLVVYSVTSHRNQNKLSVVALFVMLPWSIS